MAGGSPLGGLGATSLDQEVTKAALEAEMTARPKVGRAVGSSHDPDRDETSVPSDVQDLLESSWMTGQELRAFTEFSTCSGASAEIAELTAIKVGLSTKSGGGTGALGDAQGGRPGSRLAGQTPWTLCFRG